MKPTISILGCGWLGMPLACHLIQQDYLIKGSTTTNQKLDRLKTNGITPFLLNIQERDTQIADFLASEILIIAITSKSILDFEYLIQNIEKSSIQKIIFISSTSVYDSLNQEVTEKTLVKNTPLAQIEALFRENNHFKTTIIRFGGLFGYDRKPGNFFKSGKTIENPEGFVNLIHQDDCIAIIQSVINQNVWNETFNSCTDTHPKRRAFYTHVFQKAGRGTPLFNENSTNEYKIVSNKKIKEALNFSFKHLDLMNLKE